MAGKGGLYNPRPVDDIPVNGQLQHGVTSNRMFDHEADLGLHVVVVRKTANQTVNNSTVLVNDDDLLYALGANEVWNFKLYFRFDSSAVADIKHSFVCPAGGTLVWGPVGEAPFVRASGAIRLTGGQGSPQALGLLRGTVFNGATPGNLQFQWAQNVAEVSNTIVYINSVLLLTRVLLP